jgi:bile acid:Na+ symporter, BASS family
MANIMLTLIQAGAMVSTFGFVLSMGLRTPIGDLSYFGARPWLLFKSLLSVDLLVPLIAIAVIIIVMPAKPTSIGLLLLAASPAAPLVINNISKAGGRLDYAVSLQVALASLAIVTTPITLFLLSSATNLQLGVSSLAVARQVGISILVPIIAGIAIRWLFPALAGQIIRPLEVLSQIVFVLVFILVILFTYRLLLMLDIRSYLAIALMTVGSLIAGHLLASRFPEEKTTLAIESASRNSGLALLIASDFVTLEKALPVMIPYIITSALIGFIYARYRKMSRNVRSHAGSD